MTKQPDGVSSGDLFCFPTGPVADGQFQYIPGPPTVESASLMSSPAAAQLALQAMWRAEPEALQAAETAIRSKYPEAASVQLQPVELNDLTASLTVTTADGTTHTIGPNPTSGMGPQRVVFNDRLTSAEKAAATSAFQGQSGILQLTYQGTLRTRETSTVKISGDLSADMKRLAPKAPEESAGSWFSKKKTPDPLPPAPDLATCAAALDSAISSGRVKLTHVDTPNVSEATRHKANRRPAATSRSCCSTS